MLKEKANFIARKIDDNIFKVEKDRQGHFTGAIYVNSNDIIDVLNNELHIIIYDKDGQETLVDTVSQKHFGYLKTLRKDETILTSDQIKNSTVSNKNNDYNISINVIKTESKDIDSLIEEISKSLKKKFNEIKFY